MNEPSDSFQKTFFITQKHQNFLNEINENSSLALRTVLDSIMRGNWYKKRIQMIDKLLQRTSLGFILILISFLINNSILITLSISVGVFIIIYSIIGGIIDALQLSKYR